MFFYKGVQCLKKVEKLCIRKHLYSAGHLPFILLEVADEILKKSKHKILYSSLFSWVISVIFVWLLRFPVIGVASAGRVGQQEVNECQLQSGSSHSTSRYRISECYHLCRLASLTSLWYNIFAPRKPSVTRYNRLVCTLRGTSRT